LGLVQCCHHRGADLVGVQRHVLGGGFALTLVLTAVPVAAQPQDDTELVYVQVLTKRVLATYYN
jgi:hypothetical protein